MNSLGMQDCHDGGKGADTKRDGSFWDVFKGISVR